MKKPKKIKLKDVRKLHVKRGDIVVVEVATDMPPTECRFLREHLERMVPAGVIVMVVPSVGGVKILRLDQMPADFLDDMVKYVATELANGHMLMTVLMPGDSGKVTLKP